MGGGGARGPFRGLGFKEFPARDRKASPSAGNQLVPTPPHPEGLGGGVQAGPTPPNPGYQKKKLPTVQGAQKKKAKAAVNVQSSKVLTQPRLQNRGPHSFNSRQLLRNTRPPRRASHLVGGGGCLPAAPGPAERCRTAAASRPRGSGRWRAGAASPSPAEVCCRTQRDEATHPRPNKGGGVPGVNFGTQKKWVFTKKKGKKKLAMHRKFKRIIRKILYKEFSLYKKKLKNGTGYPHKMKIH